MNIKNRAVDFSLCEIIEQACATRTRTTNPNGTEANAAVDFSLCEIIKTLAQRTCDKPATIAGVEAAKSETCAFLQ